MAKFYKSKFTAAQQDALLDIVEQGGSGGEGGGSSLEYLDVSGVATQAKLLLASLSFMLKVPTTIKISIPYDSGTKNVTIAQSVAPSANIMTVVGVIDMTSSYMETAMNAISALGIDNQTEIYMSGQKMTLAQVFSMYGLEQTIATLPRITKEQFYTL